MEISEQQSSDLEMLGRALGDIRAEYELDDALYQRFMPPLYFDQLVGIAPKFLVGERGTGKTTTLRSMSFGGQAKLIGGDPSKWSVQGAYWKVEPNVVSAFKGKGVNEEDWTTVFGHYLNLKLSSLVVAYARWLIDRGHSVEIKRRESRLLSTSLGMPSIDSIDELASQLNLAMADIEARINGGISSLLSGTLSIPGRPLDYLFDSIDGLYVSQVSPFAFCLDEYENLTAYQQRVLNTLIKQVGGAPYTFKVGVRNTVAIERRTLIENQPLQDPADYTRIDITANLKDGSFESFASEVVARRLSAVLEPDLSLPLLLPGLTLEQEAALLFSEAQRAALRSRVAKQASEAELSMFDDLPALECALIERWAEAHDTEEVDVLRFAMADSARWATRVGNYGYALLFTLKENRVGVRKFYTGWLTYCQVADGNIRYLIRLVYEALRLHVVNGGSLRQGVSAFDQTKAARRVGESTISDLQGWSRRGAELTRLALGLGSVFGSLARETGLSTPEVNQFRLQYSSVIEADAEVDELLAEAVGQGILIAFDGDKNARDSGATREKDFQLHPVLAAYFTYSPRRKRRFSLRSTELMALTSRSTTKATVRSILSRRGAAPTSSGHQLELFEGL